MWQIGGMKRPSKRPATPPAQLTFVGYVRVSTAGQADRGASLPEQRERLAAWCRTHGHRLASVEEDAGWSGSVAPDARPALARALAAVRSGEAHGVVACDLSRLSRSVRDTLALVDDATRRGWRLASVSENLDTGTPHGRMVTTVLASVAQLERERTSERVRNVMRHTARQGMARSRFDPFGWRSVAVPGATPEDAPKRRLEPHPVEAPILRRIVRLDATGEGAYRIMGILNRDGVGNPRTSGPWTLGTMRAVVRTFHARKADGARSPF